MKATLKLIAACLVALAVEVGVIAVQIVLMADNGIEITLTVEELEEIEEALK